MYIIWESFFKLTTKIDKTETKSSDGEKVWKIKNWKCANDPTLTTYYGNSHGCRTINSGPPKELLPMRIHQNKKYGKLTRPGNGWDGPVGWLKTQEKGSNIAR
jgi:hypothetical protein